MEGATTMSLTNSSLASNVSEGPGFQMPPWGLNIEEMINCISVRNKSAPQDGNKYCPAVFDDWLCWDYTLASTTAVQQCPYKFKPGFSPDESAIKTCMADGTWYINPESNMTWTDYTSCSNRGQAVLYVSISGYSISCILLAISLVIFNHYRQLRCARVMLHQHLFVSFIMTGVMWIVYYSQVMANPDISRKNPAWCKVIHLATQYASLSNYFWMFCEGFFLHTVVVQAFAKQKKLLIACYFIGWGGPILFIIAYAVSRLLDGFNDIMCWYHPSWSIWILSTPVLASLLINFILLLNILRILLSKIRAFNSAEHNQNRRAVKATLILVPLLGLQNLLTVVKPPLDKDGSFYWDLASAVLVSFQGAAVAMIFCFFNGEVLTVLKRRWWQYQHNYDPSFPGRPCNNSTTMAMTLDESTAVVADHGGNTIFKNGRKPSNHNAKDSTELQLMVPEKKGEKEVTFNA